MTEVLDYSNYTFHKQLVEFHEGDMELVSADTALVFENLSLGDEPLAEDFCLSNLFNWKRTSQGHKYWAERAGW